MEDELKHEIDIILNTQKGYFEFDQEWEENTLNAILTLIRKREIEARIDETKVHWVQADCLDRRIEQLEQQLKEFRDI